MPEPASPDFSKTIAHTRPELLQLERVLGHLEAARAAAAGLLDSDVKRKLLRAIGHATALAETAQKVGHAILNAARRGDAAGCSGEHAHVR